MVFSYNCLVQYNGIKFEQGKAFGIAMNSDHFSLYTIKSIFPHDEYCKLMIDVPTIYNGSSYYIITESSSFIGDQFQSKSVFLDSSGKEYFGTDSKEKWSIEGNCLRAGLEIKGLGKEAETVVKNQPYSSFSDFLEKTSVGKGRVESLIFSGAFDCFDTRENVYNWYHNTYLSKGKKSQEAFFDFFDDESSSSDNLKHFTKNESKEMEYDINGYLIPENILDKYHEHIGTKLGDSRTVIKDIGTVKREVSRFPAILGRVDGIRMSKSRTGREWVYVAFSDGINDITVMMSKTKYLSRQKTFEIGNILVLPVSFPPGEDGETPDRETCFLSDEKIEIKRIA
jgi:DNA polymerase III alpha subunit